MSAPASNTQWYIAREGQQFGPISDAELAKFIELGHLQPNDLIWREGFPDWRPAMVVFPNRVQQRAEARARCPGAPTLRGARRSLTGPRHLPPAPGPRTKRMKAAGEPRRRGRAALVLLLVLVLGGAGWLAYPYRDRLKVLVTSMASFSTSDAFTIADRKSLEAPPLQGFADTPEATDSKLQSTALWRVLKREFPDWYAQRISEGVTLARASKDDAAVGQQMARRLVELRRQQVGNALSATLPRLKGVARTFFDNLVNLRRHSTDACFGFISQGEAHPAIVAMLQGSEQTVSLQAQLTAVFEAVAEGRKQPRVYPQPRQADYDMLAADLTKRGWTPADMQLFSNERALAQATPEKVCQMVHDWFAAQLGISDPDVQMRLLVESLRPVVAG